MGLESRVSSIGARKSHKMLDEDQQAEVTTNRNKEPPGKNVRRSTRARTKSTRLIGYERFPYQIVDVDNDLIEEVMKMVESEPIDLDLAMND